MKNKLFKHSLNRIFPNLSLFFFVFTFSFGNAPAACIQEKGPTPVFQAEYIFPLQGKHVHSSCITELPNGDILACWFQGSGERRANDVMIKGARLKKGGTQWSEPFDMADTPGNPDCNPIIFLDHKERLHLVWIVVVANKWETAILKTRISTNYLGEGTPQWDWQDIILLKPGKEFVNTLETQFKELNTPELSWAEYAPKYEKMVVEAAKDATKREVGWMGRIKPLLLPDHKILMPLYSDGFNVSLVAISDDDGDTWQPSLPIVGRGNIQPTLLQKKDGTLVAYMRDNGDSPGRIVQSTSKDNGYCWSVTGKTDIPNPGSSVDGIVLADGNWLLVCNDLENGRNRLTAYLSDDEGASWKWERQLEGISKGKGGFSYPSVIQSKDGLIHLSYSYDIDNKTIKHVSFPASWVKETPEGTTNAEKLGFPKEKKVLLLHMDDLGMCDEANQAAQSYLTKDHLRSGAVMMPCPYAEAFVNWAKEFPAFDIGVHLTLTSEWKTYRWGTITAPAKVPGLIDPEGKLWHEVPDVVMHAGAREVETEICAQIDQMIALGLTPSHIDTHMGTLYGSPEYVRVFLKTAEEYQIPANAIDLTFPEVAQKYKEAGYPITGPVVELIKNYRLPKLDNFTSVPKGKTYEEKRAGFFELIKSLSAGLTEIIFHPSVATENLKTITGSWQQREWEAQLFSDPVVIQFLKDQDIVLTNWKDIMERFRKNNKP